MKSLLKFVRTTGLSLNAKEKFDVQHQLTPKKDFRKVAPKMRRS